MNIFKNLIILFIWQGSVYIVPLFTTPYLARILGVNEFGILGVAANLIGYVSLIADWGFALSATREVARNATNPSRLRTIFWEVVFAKMLLGAVSLAGFLLIVLATPSMRTIAIILLALVPQVLASIFSASWLLQGLERIASFAIVSLLGRLLIIPLTFLFVHSAADTVVAAAIQGLTMVISSLASFVVAARAITLLPMNFSPPGVWKRVAEGAGLFLSTSAISLYTQANLVVLGFMSGPTQAGLFSGADRLCKAVQSLTGPISTAVYPRINNLMTVDPPAALRLMWLVLAGQGGITFLLSFALLLMSHFLTLMFLGSAFLPAVPVVQGLSALPFVIGLSNVFGINMMLPLGMQRQFTIATVLSGVLNLGMLMPLCQSYGAVGAAISVVTTEILVTVTMASIIYINREKFYALKIRSPIRETTIQSDKLE